MSHFIDVENAMAEVLKERLADMQPVPRIYQSRDLANIKDKSQGEVSVFVTYNGIAQVIEASNTPTVSRIIHEFIIWVAAKSAKAHGTSQGTREIADPILERIIEVLMGLRPAKGLEPLKLVSGGVGPAYATSGYGYFPLTFHHGKTVRNSTR